MKILVIGRYDQFHTVRPEAEIFISLAKIGYDVTIMTKTEYGYVKLFQDAGIKVIDFQAEKKLNKGEVTFIKNELIKGQYDVLHMFNNISMVNGIAAAKNIKVTCVLYRGYSANVNWFDPTLYMKLLHPRADYIICNSEGVATIMREKGKVNPKKLITINKGHKLEWYNDIEAYDIRKELGLSKDSLIVVLVANNRNMKGTKYLMESTKFLNPKDNMHIVLVGKDLDDKKNMNILQKSEFRKNVHFLGFRKNALNIVKSCDIFLLTSIKGESITKSVIEAMSLGLAPVISNIIGNKELVEDGESGLVVPSKDSEKFAKALMELFKNRTLLNKIKENAPKRIASRLNHNRTVEKYEEFYKRLAK
jgi:glycosyltransferase involved in cell wall biosynthesis